MLAVCRQVLQDSDSAEDAFQSTFLVLAKNNINAAQLKRIGQSCDDYAALEKYWQTELASIPADFLNRAGVAENRFHGTIMEASENGAAARIVENLRVLQYNRFMTANLPPAIVLDLLKLTCRSLTS